MQNKKIKYWRLRENNWNLKHMNLFIPRYVGGLVLNMKELLDEEVEDTEYFVKNYLTCKTCNNEI
tara:strand:- start:448 stop:642 length:195 start_codon:yes stop_codon:yes gene_type:complete